MLKSIAFVGGGAMGEAIIRGLIGKALVEARNIVVGEPVAERRAALVARHGIRTTASNAEATLGAEVVLLAIKPQHAAAAFRELRGTLTADQLVLSIIAGVTMPTIVEALDHRRVVRVMPNTPAQVGEGMSVWTATPDVNEAGRLAARTILECLGREVAVPEEKYLDMATALNGSGPGYFFLFFEAMVDAGVRLGFARPIAELLVLQTALGSAKMALESGKHLAELRNLVTSPAGTTAAGLAELEEGRLRSVVDRAVFAAYERSRELGQAK